MALGIAPGAHWETKRWPTGHFVEFINRFREISSAPVTIFLGPQEQTWFAESDLAPLASRANRVTVFQDRSLVEVATRLATCSTLLTNDSGLLHLAEAVGTPVLALFGPTVREFGYFPLLNESQVLQVDLDCRPCSRNGKRPCHRRDKACLVRITPERALAQLLKRPGWQNSTAEENRRG
jgi:heptosyltransferase-2